MRAFKYLLFLLLVLCPRFVGAQESEGKVFFLGIGVEKCQSGTPGKPNAVADVQLVMERTKKDVKTTDNITYVHDGGMVTATNFVGYTLFNDFATLENVDSLFNEIAKKAKPHDVFYIYISAESSGESGGFILPPKTALGGQKKTKPAASSKTILELSVLGANLNKLLCQNQIIVTDGMTWGENHENIMPLFFAPAGQEKNQIVLVPIFESTDSFDVAGKKAGALAAVICNASKPVLRLLKKNDQAIEGVKTSLSIAFNNLTGSDNPICAVYTSWKLVKAASGADPIVKQEVKPDPTKQPEVISRTSSGTVPDLPEIETNVQIRNYALIIANQNYQNVSAWPTLNNPIADAYAIKTELEVNFNYEVRVCTNLTLDSMLTEINNLNNKGFDENTQVLFYYAGHGGQKKLGTEAGTGYMVPIDGRAEESDKNLTSYLGYETLKARLDGLRARHVLAMIDACFSGSADAAVFARESQNTEMTAGQLQRSSVFVQMKESMKKRSRYFICSGTLNPVSDGVKGQLSPFAKIFIATLRDAHANGGSIVYASDVESALYAKLDSRPYAFAFGGASNSANGYMFVPKSLLKN